MAIPLGIMLGGLGLGALSSVGNYILGKKSIDSQNAANNVNIAMQRETNDMNYKMWQEQNAENWKMFNATNVYNDPSAIRARYERAGINPALAMANQGAIAAQSLNQPSSAPAVAPKMNAVDYSSIQSGINSSVSSFWDSLMSAQQFQSNNIDLSYKHEDWRARIDKMYAEYNKLLEDKNLSKVNRDVAEENLNFLQSIRKYQKSSAEFNAMQMQIGIDKMREEYLLTKANKDAVVFQNELNKDLKGLTIGQASANLQLAYQTIANMEIQGRKTEAEIKNVLADTNYKWLQGQNLGKQNKFLDAQYNETYTSGAISQRVRMRDWSEKMAEQQWKMFDLNIGRDQRHEDMPILYDNPLMNLFKGFVIK